ncbi:MAG TPA: DUF5715 family protein, partial [Thermoanaerobaculia bacterium]|nr:DUF5715 family protein [Thermoanaerobaculia bacterium]
MRDIDLRRVSLRSALTGLALLALAPAAGASSLTPTRDGLLRQVRAAQEHGYSYLQSDSQVLQFERAGLLVRLPGNGDYEVKETVRHPLARPAVKHFVEQLAAGYRDACGERLVVTSLVRPRNRQPANASPLSVHPTGMAMDLRISSSWSCRSWLERRL